MVGKMPDSLESQVKELAAKIAQHKNALELHRLFEQAYFSNRLSRVEDKLKTARRLEDCPRMSESR